LKRLRAKVQSIDARIDELERRMRRATVDEYIDLLRQHSALHIKRQAVSDHLLRITKRDFKKDVPESMGYQIVGLPNNKKYKP